MGYKKISDYGIVGNGLTLAIVGIDGSIDWMCLPYLDSPSVFAAILDDRTGGRFSIKPSQIWDSAQRYLPRTNILQTLFRTAHGEIELVDFMPAGPEADLDEENRHRLLRRLRGVAGKVTLHLEFSPRFDYARQLPTWSDKAANLWSISTADHEITLFATRELQWSDEQVCLEIQQGETIWLGVNYGAIETLPDSAQLELLLNNTEQFWKQWVRAQETGKYPLQGFWQETLDRSALVLKLLQFKDTGAIAAAASCSLPTIVYGQRNWDYRFSWIRDTSMTLSALFELGHMHEVSLYLEWLKKIFNQQHGPDLDILYKLREPTPPSGEHQLEHLAGYKHSKPVNIGQFNVGQHQHDIYGELLEMIFAISRLVGKIDPEYWTLVRRQVDHVTTIWRDKDHGIWELRTGPYHVTHSKLYCWVALDRGIKIAEHYGFPAEIDKWKRERDAVHADILQNAYNKKLGYFTQYYGSDELDASLLHIPLVGFLPIDDPRIAQTIAAIEKELLVDGVIIRYKYDDGLPGQEHGFLICLFWYLRCLIRQKRFAEVEGHLRQVEKYANHLGLFGEQFDPRFQEITGNIPQAFSHIGYTTTVLEYLDAQRTQPYQPDTLSVWDKFSLLLSPRLLTPDISEKPEDAPADPGQEVKRIMNILRGQFYDGQNQKVNYGLIRNSDYYQDFLKAVAALQHFDPQTLPDDHSKIAFWINVFNALVIHGVIELGIKESVKEVPLFFERVQYLIGDHHYTLSDIEHGILRNNARRPPLHLKKVFSDTDPRLALSIKKVDPRVHFALVCASRTCPPIETYTADQLDQQLDDSARVFINATTQIISQENTIGISKIFKWYRSDFQRSDPALIHFIAEYLYDPTNAEWLRQQSQTITIKYLPYDWRLNR